MVILSSQIDLLAIKGVSHYIIVDQKGETIAHNLGEHQKTGAMIHFCGQQSVIIGKSQLKFITFKRKSKKDLFIFPFGNYYLGVIKNESIAADELAENVLSFLNNLKTANK